MKSQERKKGYLTFVGTGITAISHLTIEAISHIEASDKVLYLLNIEEMAEWIESKNARTESLHPIYNQKKTKTTMLRRNIQPHNLTSKRRA